MDIIFASSNKIQNSDLSLELPKKKHEIRKGSNAIKKADAKFKKGIKKQSQSVKIITKGLDYEDAPNRTDSEYS